MKELVGTRLPGLDFVGLACAHGCHGVRVERPEDLAATLERAFASPTPFLVDVTIG
jgi:acetolactate synthase I/II/III large subunit